MFLKRCCLWLAASLLAWPAAAQILVGQTSGFSGPVAAGVKETTDGAKLWINAVNARGGVNGQRIELISLDDKFEPPLAAANAKTLIVDRGVIAIFLNRGTPHTEAIRPLLEQYHVPLIGPSTGAMVLHKPVHPLIFNVRATYQREAEKAVQHLATIGMRRIAVVHVDDSFGADAAYTAGPFTLRGEGAFVLNRAFSRDLNDLITNPAQLAPQIAKAFEQFSRGVTSVPIDVGPTFVQKDSFEWGFGGDYTWEGWFALLQINQTDVFDNPVDLLIHNVETRFLANVRKSWFQDTLRAQFITLYGLSGYFVAFPRLSYFFTDNIDAQVGYLCINGSRNTIVGQYKQNDEGFIRLRLTF